MKTLDPPPNARRVKKVSGLLSQLDQLINENAEEKRRLSIYIPAGTKPGEVSEARIHLKNAMTRADDLATSESDQAILKSLEKRLSGYLEKESEGSDFWQKQMGGLAIFVDCDDFRIVEVSKAFQPRVLLSDRWFLTPLLELAANVDSYWLLSLSQNGVSFYRGSRLGIREMELAEDELTFDSSETASRRSSGDDPDLIDATADKENLTRFFKEVNSRVVKAIGDNSDPLLLAGVDFYNPLYQSANTYDHLAEEMVEGNFEHESLDELHSRALETLHSEFIESRKRELFRLRTVANSDLFESDLREILAAAGIGRVKALVVPSDAMHWGRVKDPVQGAFDGLPDNDPNGQDLYQLAAELTLNNGGQTFYLAKAKMPGGHDLCAELRY